MGTGVIERPFTRQVVGELRSVRLLGAKPSVIPRNRPRGVKAVGIRYENNAAKALERALPNVHHGQWIEFEDAKGVRYCQPDVYHVADDRVVVFECKLTDVEVAKKQLLGLYLPILRKLYARRVLGIVVTRHLTRVSDRESICDGLELALSRAERSIPTLHWLGKGRL